MLKNQHTLKCLEVLSENDKAQVKYLFMAYQEELGLDLCFQGFAEEVKNLPGVYKEPNGAILVASYKGSYIGIVALKSLDEGICEMKRLYVNPSHRGQNIGEELVSHIITLARNKGYHTMKLDTLSRLKQAIALYQKYGFKQTKAYNFNPDNTVQYYSLPL